MNDTLKLAPVALCMRCDPAQFAFDTTAELPDAAGAVGQARAREAVSFGLGIRRQGYNLFVMGSAGTGKHTLVQQYLKKPPADPACRQDWVYVNNFPLPHKPLALALPAGRGRQLREDMQRLVEELGAAIPAAFESEEYRSRNEQIEADFSGRQQAAFAELGKDAEKESIGLLRTPSGFTLAPLKDGEVINAEDYAKLPADEQKRLDEIMSTLRARLERIFHDMRQWQREHRDKVRELNREVSLYAVGNLMEEIKDRYAELPDIRKYLEAVQQDVIDNADDFQRHEDRPPGPLGMPQPEPSFRRYAVNVMVDCSEPDGPPIVYEDSPNYQNLVGRVEHIAQFGMLATDFSLIKPGALHRANGGYLLLDVHKLLSQPFAWEALKRALSNREIRIESIGQLYSLASTESIEPEPVPLDVKVVLFGERMYYYLLHAHDPDFWELFKVAADFDEELERSNAAQDHYAGLIANIARRENMLPFDRTAVARVIEQTARRAGDAKKLSTNLQEFADLLGEAEFFARGAALPAVQAQHVQQAIDAQIARADRVRLKLQETIMRGTIMIDTAGGKIGQVNGLSVYNLGNFTFGQPTRITATTRLGDGKVIDVQREVDLGGAVHSKGVLILSSFLAARFSHKRLHSVSASLVFEQTYSTVDGDSASVAELTALMSSLAELPVRQSFAVTGSVDQLGHVQAIGGVNEKIEGFYDICNARGLTGENAVVIPAANVEHLMLRADVVQAVADGKFSVYAAQTVDEALELLLGVAAGTPDATGEWPADSVNGRVAMRLRSFSAARLDYAARLARKRRLPGAHK